MPSIDTKKLLSLLLPLAMAACSLSGQATQTAGLPATGTPPAASLAATLPPRLTTTPAATVSATPAASATPSAPAGAILVDTFDQEVFPFKPDGNCSLGEAIAAAQSGQDVDGCHGTPGSSTIYLPAGTYTLTGPDAGSPPLPGAEGRLGFAPGGFPVIYTRVTILGNGSVIQRSGAVKFPIFQAAAQADLTLQDLTVRGGDSSGTQYASGGAIQLLVGTVTLDHVTLSDNVSGQDGGAVDVGQAPLAKLVVKDALIRNNTAAYNGGGINDDGLLTVTNSTIEGNTAGGVEGGGGVFVTDNGSATITGSMVAGNQAWIGGGIFSQGSLTVSGSVISGNRAMESRFTVPTGGGGIAAAHADAVRLTVKDSFILGNRAAQSIGGGISVGVADAGDFRLTGSVVAGNQARDGGGIAGGPGSVAGSCLLDNAAGGSSAGDLDGSLQAGGNWWGPGGSPHVSRGVTTAPLLAGAPAICAAALPTPYPTIVGTPVSP